MDRIINHFGEWTLIFIFLTLSMTPLRKITKSLEWIKFRRMLGLFAFFYASVHMLSYVGLDYRFDFEPLINDVLKKKFISLLALSKESEPCTEFLSIDRPYNFLIVLFSACFGSVEPIIFLYEKTAFLPSNTMTTIGPEDK